MGNQIYTDVTNAIIDLIESDQALPWVKDWSSTSAAFPVNSITNRHYNGINVLILWVMAQKIGYTSNEWMTFKQGQSNDLAVMKGQKSTKIIFYKNWTTKDPETGEDKTVPMLRTYSVFNKDQFAGDGAQSAPVNALPGVDQFIVNIGHETATGEPCFVPSKNLVRMPLADTFVSSGSYYATYLHELIHWSGHESRLNRDLKNRFGDDAYIAEELIAELGSAFLCAELGIPGDNRHAGYIKGWLDLLKKDNKAIFTAAAAASKACEFLHGFQQ